jgi:hypothetical protein
MNEIIAAVQKCRDDIARTECEDMYIKYPDGQLVMVHSKEDGRERVNNLDSIIERLYAMEKT